MAKIQNFNLVKGLRFWLQFQKYQKIQIGGGAKKGQKKVVHWCVPLKYLNYQEEDVLNCFQEIILLHYFLLSNYQVNIRYLS